MGFATVGSGLASSALSNAIGLLDDFSGLLGLVFGVAVLALLFGVVKAFLPR